MSTAVPATGVVVELAPPDGRPPTSLAALVPGREVAFATSGHTGTPRVWLRTGAQLLAEARILLRELALDACDGVVCCAPLEHLYGFVAGLCVAGAGNLPLWVRPTPSDGSGLPDVPAARPVVVALPSTLGVLARQGGWLAARPGSTVLHSTARLPDGARELARALPDVRMHELFGSTETGLVAHRPVGGDPTAPWEPAPDVDIVRPTPGRPGRLVIASPRVARQPGGVPTRHHELADEVVVRDDHRFTLLGRGVRLVKLNGRRVDLDAVEASLRDAVECADLACVPRRDELRGEAYDLLVVPSSGGSPDPGQIRMRARRALAPGCEPRRIRVVGHLPRSDTGKLAGGPR